MVRKSLNLLVDEELVQKARNHGLNLSKFFENQLRGYFDFIEERQQNYYYSKNLAPKERTVTDGELGLLRFELKSITPEATRIPSYPTGPNSQNKK